jgi:CheY-like chemotaxis protein
VRAAAAKVLSSCGYTVIEATGAREALDLAGRRAGPIDLLITDVVMPGMGGRELAALFMPLRPTTRILFMSGYTGDAIAHHALLEPGVHYLQKPFSRDVIARKVREVLDG